MKAYFIVTLANVDFLFRYFIENDYKYGENHISKNQSIKTDVVKSLLDKAPKIVYFEIDDRKKRYNIFVNWFLDTDLTDNVMKAVNFWEINFRTSLKQKKESI